MTVRVRHVRVTPARGPAGTNRFPPDMRCQL